jgi:CxxC motif-containing protein (DUF1111 family)
MMHRVGILSLGLLLFLSSCMDTSPKYDGDRSGSSNANPDRQPATPDPAQGEPTPGNVGKDDPASKDPASSMPGSEMQTESTFKEKEIKSYADLGPMVNSRVEDGVVITEGVIRPRRRHENDMDFAKYNPFYWQGRESFFKVEDFTAKGEKKMRFTLRTDWPQNYIPTRGPDFSAIYKGDPLAPDETTRSKFAINTRMDHKGEFKNFEATIDEAAFNVYGDALKKGALLIFEFRFFMDESNPDWQKQKQVNPANLSAYYSEFFRIKIGEGGLYIDDTSDVKKLPPPQKYAGGWLTTPLIKVEPWRALQQQSTNLTAESSQTFLNGRTWFHTDMVDGHHQGDEADDKPSIFFPVDTERRKGIAGSALHVRACNGCHYNNGQKLLPPEGQPVIHTLAKTSDKTTGKDHKVFGLQLQPNGEQGEGTLKVVEVVKTDVKLKDGTVVTLKKNIFAVDSTLDKTNLGLSIRRPMGLMGVGLLNAVPDATIRSMVGRRGGEVSVVNGKVSRFGWKADQPMLIDQIAAAMRNDLAVRNDIYPKLDCFNGCKEGKEQLALKTMEEIETYISLLGVPPRINPEDSRVVAGEKIFRSVGCAQCHVPTLQTGPSKFKEIAQMSFQPFTDLLLHDLGPGLADDSGRPNASKWRTAPLWAMKNVRAANENHSDKFPSGEIHVLWTDTHREAAKNRIQLLHDGRAESIAEAVLWHGGEAAPIVEVYKSLSKEDREALEAFIWDL